MSVLFILIPLSIVLASLFLWAFIWAVRSGQYDDTQTPSLRVLLDDAPVNKPPDDLKMNPNPMKP
jgi:cbb3-type cytochrome oxidase maturation protein